MQEDSLHAGSSALKFNDKSSPSSYVDNHMSDNDFSCTGATEVLASREDIQIFFRGR